MRNLWAASILATYEHDSIRHEAYLMALLNPLVAHGFGIWLCEGVESKEHLVFILNPCKEVWTLVQEISRSLPSAHFPVTTADVLVWFVKQ